MLVNTQAASVIQQSKRSDMDPANAAASALYSGVMQNVQNAVTATQVQATQKAKDTTADNVEAAFAKTRVQLQTTPETTATPKTEASTQARADFNEYMTKTPAERIRDQILKEKGLTEEDVKSMPIEQQTSIANEVADRLKAQTAEQIAAKTADPQVQAVKETLAAI
ncbi:MULTISPECIES: hypothetical protein [unclassified Pseudomonas]|uniref:hypothetical protein n=1 Tax=unclassified Pseudomonas TaxID=196821 RepID=UPI0011EC7146|nr:MULTISPECIES: hypothetical protein [unclassified Pseudomonas]KAA0943882.1 hypothetical protein FQ182_22930 [Pseudomonas sp. ANT_H4]KAA0950972.1 hypothetical protein FQ186_19050 [Pseudomonas sp. ANT_H14]